MTKYTIDIISNDRGVRSKLNIFRSGGVNGKFMDDSSGRSYDHAIY